MCSAIVRTQNEASIDITDLNVENLVSPHMRFGIIPAGSANSIASSIHGVDDQVTAALQIAIGSKTPVDCCTIHEKNNLVRISANACSYGWLGAVMEDSEKFRCLGPIRYQFSGL
jgi:ceramide kinase